MSILIKGVSMPKNCGECPCYYDGYCHGLQYREEDEDYRAVSYREYDKKRRDDCPLIEVPPHGRLIDADALHIQLIDKELDQLQPWTSFGDYREVLQMIDDAPTIIETSPYRYEMIGKTDKPHGIYIIKSEE